LDAISNPHALDYGCVSGRDEHRQRQPAKGKTDSNLPVQEATIPNS